MPKVISLFSGAGGLDYGLEAAGFDFAAGVEMDADCVATLLESRPDWPVLNRSIFDVTSRELLRLANSRKGEVDLVVGGPPCQPFSKAGYWASGDAGRLTDPRANTLTAYLRVVRDVLPRVILLENVEGLVRRQRRGSSTAPQELRAINKAEGTLDDASVAVLNAADFGVPQLRERVFIVAQREGRPFTFPKPTHSAIDAERLVDDVRQPHRQPGMHLEICRLRAMKTSRYEANGPTCCRQFPRAALPPSHRARKGYAPFWLAAALLDFSAEAGEGPTFVDNPGSARTCRGPFHWSNRRLSVRELCRLQTFPDDVSIVGERGSAQKQLGNAVPSLLAEVLGREIREQLLGGRRIKNPLTLLPPRRTPVPPPERPRAVPKRFHSLAGKHSAHPGQALSRCFATPYRIRRPVAG